MGKVFSTLVEREKQGVYAGTTIQFIPHVTDVIKDHFFKISSKEKADILLVEIGGTVGDLENEFYIEAARQLSHIVGPDNYLFAHLTYVPIPIGTREQKSKPTQMSVRDLNEKGIYPDIIIGRCGELLTPKIKEKIALYGNIPGKNVISELDVKSVYEIPLGFQEEGILDIIFKKLKLAGANSPRMGEWKRLVDISRKNYKEPRKTLNVALCGKYTQLEDSYASVREAIIHAVAHLNVAYNLKMIDTEFLEKPGDADNLEYIKSQLADVDAVIVPGGFGSRGIEGKISVIQVAREMRIPFLGISYGMQLAVVEFARHKCALPFAGTMEIESEGIEVKEPVIAYLPGPEYVKVLDGMLRKGGHDVFLKKGSFVEKIYDGASVIRERFRHRYEVNPRYVSKIEENGMLFSGYSAKEDSIMQMMEISDHPFFVGCQFHPELTSNLLKPSPLFYHLLRAGEKRQDERMAGS
jgi:CTP synthase